MERLFEEDLPRGGQTRVPARDQPLAARMRPDSLDELVGQEHLLEAGSALRVAIEEGRPHSMVLYGPPGSGKTTLARLIAGKASAAFEELSAVNAGRQEVRDVIERAGHRRATSGEGTCCSSTRSTASTRHSRTPCCPPWRRGWSRSWARPPRTPTSR